MSAPLAIDSNGEEVSIGGAITADTLGANLSIDAGTTGEVELGPVVHVANERARLSSPQYEHITVTPKGVTLGAEISGVRLSGDLPDEVIAEIRRAWLDYKVVYLRDQDISSTEHVEFARRFGELEVHPFLLGSEEHPELVRFEKGVEAGGF